MSLSFPHWDFPLQILLWRRIIENVIQIVFSFDWCQKEGTLKSSFLRVMWVFRFQWTFCEDGFGLIHNHCVVDKGLKHGHVDYFRHVGSIFSLFSNILQRSSLIHLVELSWNKVVLNISRIGLLANHHFLDLVIVFALDFTSIAHVSERVIKVITIQAYPVTSPYRILLFLVIILIGMIVWALGLIFLDVLFVTLLQFVQEEILFHSLLLFLFVKSVR